MQFYMVGIKGAGMSALANILCDLGHDVVGVDYNKKYFTQATFRSSIYCENFDNYKLKKEYFYIIGNAFKLSKITEEIITNGYNFEYYSEFLESFFKMKKIGISGSHGKTTTTCFTSSLIGQNANVLIGDGTGIGVLDAKYFLFEACEYQNNFLKYNFDYLIILNIDYDHPDFFKNENDYFRSFQKAALNSKILISNYDDPLCKRIIHSNKLTFGFDPDADLVIAYENEQLILSICDEKYVIDFPFSGKHLCYDFAASFLVCYLLEGNAKNILNRISNIHLPRRRLNEYKIQNNIVVNDYAHHPTEIKAVYDSLSNKYPEKKLVAIFQPHTYSRTSSFLPLYIDALNLFSEIYIMPIFSSVREEEKEKWLLLESDLRFKKYDRSIRNVLFENDNLVVVFMGAGDIDLEFEYFIE